MQAKELQPLDLVSYKGKVFRVISIDYMGGLVGIDSEFDCDLVSEKEIEPILFTEEILKAIGFEDKPGKARYGSVFYGMFIGDISISFEVDNGLPILTIEDTSDRSKQHNIICLKDEVYNVHELQHALRLCGLNDLADHLKV